MRYAFSNIAWSPADDADVFALLRSHGVTGIEVAPTKLWPDWAGATPAAARAVKGRLADAGFEVPALQAVLFGRPAARLFGADGARELCAHLASVAELAGAIGARAIVLGAPQQRDRGELTPEQAFDRALPVLRGLARRFADAGCCLCIEPNPVSYGCNFITDAMQGAALVRAVDHPGFGLHLDAAAMHLAGDDLAELWPQLGALVRHYHISEPQLAGFAAPRVPHARNLATLRDGGYEGWCSVEMREPAEPLAQVGPWALLRDAQR